MFDISPLARKYAPWSISKAAIGETCPAQFAHKYVRKTPEVMRTSPNKVGTAAHAVLELRLGGKTEAQAKATALAKTPLTSNELDDLHAFDGVIDGFLRRFERFCKANGVTEVLLEVEWAITADYRPTKFFAKDVYFRGKVDLAAVTRHGDLFVIDHKSGVAVDIGRDPKFKHQLHSYAVLAHANRPELAGVRGGIHFLQGEEKMRLQWLDYVESPRIGKVHAPWLYEYLNSVAGQLEPPFEGRPKAKWPCAWCGFRPVCEAYREMTLASEV